MKISNSLRCALLAQLVLYGLRSDAQLVQGVANAKYMQPTNVGVTVPNYTRSFGVGYFNTNGTYPNSFLHVNTLTNYALLPGNGTIANFGEVFRTTGLLSADNYWRMFLGGSAATQEAGQLFCTMNSVSPNLHFNINAPNGHLRLWTNTIERARLNSNVISAMGPLNEFPNVNRDGYLLLSGVPAAFTDPNSRAPFTRLHLVDQIVPGTPNNYAQQQGFRPWQRNGITLTGNNDQSYIGHRYDAVDNTDLVLQWSDNPDSSPWGTDRMKFVFTTLYNAGAARGAATMNGLEAMRLYPETYEEVNVGIGDFSQAGMGDPTERVDMLDGRLRIRQLPNDPIAPTLTKFLVVDSIPGSEFGVVKWRNLPSFTSGGTGCEWTLQNDGVSSGAVHHNLFTAVGTNDDCPDDADAIGIGYDIGNGPTGAVPDAKLEVYTENFHAGVRVMNYASLASVSGLRVDAVGGTSSNNGLYVTTTQTAGAENYGTRLFAYGVAGGSTNNGLTIEALGTGTSATAGNNGLLATITDNNTSAQNLGASFSVTGTGDYAANGGISVDVTCAGDYSNGTGISALVLGGGQDTELRGAWIKTAVNHASAFSYGVDAQSIGACNVNYGVRGFAENGAKNYGVWGGVADTTVNDWAGYFVGNVNCTATGYYVGGSFVASDESLKTNIQPLGSAMEIVSQLQPHTYTYVQGVHPHVYLPVGEQTGLIAQELEAVLPALVSNTAIAAAEDSAGNVLHEAVEYKAINYAGLVPVLIAAIQEQNSTITTLQQQVAAAQAQPDQMATLQEQLIALQAQVANCCAIGGGLAPQGGSDEGGLRLGAEVVEGDARKLTIQPNPFTDHTTLYYTLARSGRMQLLANSADGKQLRVLDEANREAGQYQLEWNTQDLSPGVYYVTLLLDGEPIVKKAVRVRE